MANDLSLILRIKADNSSVLGKVADDIDRVGTSAQAADTKLKGASGGIRSFAENASKAGQGVRQSIAGISQLSSIASSGLSNVSADLNKVATAAGSVVAGFAAMGPAGLIVSGVSIAISLLVDHLNRQAAATAKAKAEIREYEAALRAQNDAARQAVQASAPKEDPLESVAKDIPLSIDKLNELMEVSDKARDLVNRLLNSESGSQVLEDRIARLTVRIRDLKTQLSNLPTEGGGPLALQAAGVQDELRQAENEMRVYTDALVGSREAQRQLKGEIANTSEAQREQEKAVDGLTRRWGALNEVLLRHAELSSQASADAARWSDYNRRVATSIGETTRSMEKNGQTLDEYNTKWDRLEKEGLEKAKAAAQRAAAAWDQLKNSVRGYLEQALQPTLVSQDQLDAAMKGKYVNTWDEFRRRVEAVATGTPIEEFGENFKAQLEKVQGLFGGLSLDQIASKFKDFSLFSDKGTFKDLLDTGIVDLDAVIANVNSQIDGLIGRANLVREAFARVWDGLSGQKKIDLANALGIDGASGANIEGLKADIEDKITNPADEAAGKVGEIGAAVKEIPTSVTSVIDIQKTETFDETLKDILAEVAKIPTEILIKVGMQNGIPNPDGDGGSNNNGSEGGKATGGYAKKGRYKLGEAGEEFVLPSGLVKWIESILGGRISDPREIEWLIKGFKGGPTELKNQLELWAGGRTGGAYTLPTEADSWIRDMFGKFEFKYGARNLPRDTSGGGAAAGGEGTGGGAEISHLLQVSQSMEQGIWEIVKLLSQGGGVGRAGALSTALPDYDAIARRLGKRAVLKGAQMG